MINTIISISIMDTIFNESKIKLKPGVRMLYQNILNYWFGKQEQKVGNLQVFEMFKVDVKYDKFKDEFEQLEKGGLIDVRDNKIFFVDVWTKHIPTHLLSSKKYEQITADEVKDELYNSHALLDIVRMKYRVNIKQCNRLLQMFFLEQEGIQTKYNSEGQVRKHFIYWVQSNKDKVTQESTSSKGKILGR